MNGNGRGGWRQDFGVVFILLFAAGLLLRLVLLGHTSFWIDEIPTVGSAISQKSLSTLYATELERFTWYHHLPMLDAVILLFTRWFGFTGSFPSEWLARLPFALLGAFTLPLLYLLGKSVRDRAVGLWTMFLGTVSVFHIFYSREAYAYSLLIFFAAGVSWLGIRLVRDAIDGKPFRWPLIAGYILFSAGFLQSHLGALLFLIPWNGMMMLAAGAWGGWKNLLKPARLASWALILGAAYLVFFPFLLRLAGGYTTTDASHAVSFSWRAIPAVLGRMAWGESLAALLPAFLLLGFACAGEAKTVRGGKPSLVILAAVQIAVYFVFQSWMQVRSNSRLEVRYYSAFYPLLLLVLAVGIEGAVAWAGERFKKVSANALRGVVAAVLLLWLAPSVWLVVTLQCRGWANYKGIAEWIMKNVPENGIYAFYNVYEFRGVPQVYPTPGRTATSVAQWSTDEDFKRVQPPQRALSLFSRFPQICFVEIAPEDLLAPRPDVPPIARDALFMRREWVEDPNWDRLMRLRTFPLGDLQFNATNAHKVLMSYNKLEDMPQLAARRGESFYHYFGPEWKYYRDQNMNDWLVDTGYATLHVGSATGQPRPADLVFQVMAPPNGCRWSLYAPDGSVLVDKAVVSAAPSRLSVRNLVVPPGGMALTIQVLPPPNQMEGVLCVYGVNLQDPSPAPAASSN